MKKSFRPEVRPEPTSRPRLLHRLVLAGLVAQALAGCGGKPLFTTIAEKAHTTARWGTCLVDSPPGLSDLAHPSARVDNWSECVEPPRISAGRIRMVPLTPPTILPMKPEAP